MKRAWIIIGSVLISLCLAMGILFGVLQKDKRPDSTTTTAANGDSGETEIDWFD